MKIFPPFPRLYAISPAQENTAVLQQQMLAVLKNGVPWVQYRDKHLPALKRLEQAQMLRQLCTQYGAQLFINDDVELAKTCHADGIHLGQSDVPLIQARAQLGSDIIIGITCHDRLELAQQAVTQGADYISFGCFFPSITKPDAKRASLCVLTEAKKQFSLPIVAIGGITLENAPSVIEAGADILALSAGLFSHTKTDALSPKSQWQLKTTQESH